MPSKHIWTWLRRVVTHHHWCTLERPHCSPVGETRCPIAQQQYGGCRSERGSRDTADHALHPSKGVDQQDLQAPHRARARLVQARGLHERCARVVGRVGHRSASTGGDIPHNALRHTEAVLAILPSGIWHSWCSSMTSLAPLRRDVRMITSRLSGVRGQHDRHRQWVRALIKRRGQNKAAVLMRRGSADVIGAQGHSGLPSQHRQEEGVQRWRMEKGGMTPWSAWGMGATGISRGM